MEAAAEQSHAPHGKRKGSEKEYAMQQAEKKTRERRARSGEHIQDHEEVARWFRSQAEHAGNGYVEFVVEHPSAKRGGNHRHNLEAGGSCRSKHIAFLKREAEDKAQKVIAIGKLRDIADLNRTELRYVFDKELKDCIHLHNLDSEQAWRVFFNKPGNRAVFWNADREHQFRVEYRKKRMTGSLSPKDPLCDTLLNFYVDWKDKNSKEIPVADFICSSDVSWSRPSEFQAGRSKYTTFLQKQTTDKTGHHAQGDPTPQSMWPIFGNIKGEGGTRNNPVAWVPFDKDFIAHLKPALDAYAELKNYEHGTYYTTNNAYREAVRYYAQAAGYRDWRKQDLHTGSHVPRLEKPAADEIHDIVLRALTPPGQDAPSEARMIHDELQRLSEIWDKLAHVVAGRFNATVDWHYSIVAEMLNSEALVSCCDCTYVPPSELTFRDVVNDKMSFAEPSLYTAIKEDWFVDVVPRSVPIAGNNAPYQEYTVRNDEGTSPTVFRVYPYAAMLTPNRLSLYVNLPVLRLCHRDVYDQVKYKLWCWYIAGMVGGGFCNPHSIARRQNTDDPVFGKCGPWGSHSIVELRPTIKRISSSGLKRWRYRRPRADEEGLPDTEFPFLAELSCGIDDTWIVWTNGTFYAELNPGSRPRRWAPLPRDDDGVFKPLGWVEGDDPPAGDDKDRDLSQQKQVEWECSHEYGVVDWEQLLPARSELPALY